MLKNIIKESYIETMSLLLWLLSMAINKTVRLNVVGEEYIKENHKEGKNVVFAFWHQATFPLFYYYRNRNVFIAPLDNTEGEILARFARRYKCQILRTPAEGDSFSRAKSSLSILKSLKNKYDCAIAVDGPPGESIFKVKPGGLFLSKKTGRVVVPVGVHARCKITLPMRWDKYFIPLPFSRVIIVFDKPFRVSSDINGLGLKNESEKLEKTLHKITHKAKGFNE
ncbi:MAG: hypothetical protein U9R38_07695 [Candidatus Margulisiibacteriota bacterium]|nr:hypothetical protein [Candidatus Margulisiibacteriota bacterium]